jgi:flagellar biosynthesis protein FlhA
MIGMRSALGRGMDLVLPVGLIASVLVIIVPLPPALLDVLLSLNIATAVLMLLTTIYVRTPLEFSVFPSLLLATTLARLVLNVATTRLILTRGQSYGLEAAGGVVRGFGQFVAGDKLAVGLVIFAIIVLIQFVVITKGATRISEVSARFALDGMPGRQMAIDADLNAGTIDADEARRRRAEITQQADFFGAMDGASKFVRGDAIAGIVIMLVNIVGGLFIGVFDAGMPIGQAAEIFTKLTIGDGLVSQVPAFLISLSAGLLVTRSSTESNLPTQFISQLFARPQALLVTCGFLGLLVFTSLPTLPLLAIGGGCAAVAISMTRKQKAADAETTVKQQAKKTETRVEDYLSVDPMAIELGMGLVRLADPKRGGDLLDRVQRVRQSIACEIGIIMPKVRVRDNLQLAPSQYRIKVLDTVVAEGQLHAAMYLAVDSGAATGRLAGAATAEPVSGSPAVWIDPDKRDRAEMFGYRVMEPAVVLSNHLAHIVRKHADELLTRDATRHLVDELKTQSPAVVEELIPGQMKLAEVQQVLQLLLREGVPIRPLGSIFEALGECVAKTREPSALAEHVRERLARTISARYRDASGRLSVVMLDPAVEDSLGAAMSPPAVESLCRNVSLRVDALSKAGRPPVVLVRRNVRAALKSLTASRLPQLVVLSSAEITRDTQIDSVAVVQLTTDN